MGRARKNAKPQGPQAPKFALTDPSNHVLALPTPAAMVCGVYDTDKGEKLFIMTIRTPTTTLSLGLTAGEAAGWIGQMAQRVNEMQQAAKESGG